MSLTVVIPTIDEEANLRTLLPAVREYADEVVIVDDGSTDGTVAFARESGCVVIERPRRMGVSSAVHDGIRAATRDWVAVMDADGSHPPDVLRARVLLERDLCDIVKFSRFSPGGGMHRPLRSRMLSRYNRMLAWIAGVRVHDLSGAYLIGRREDFAAYRSVVAENPLEGWMVEFVCRNRRKRIAEVPYFYGRRGHGTTHNSLRLEIVRVFWYAYLAFRCRW